MPDRLFSLVERDVSRLGGGEAELWVRHARVRRYEARDGGIDAISFSDTLSLGVRVFRDGRMGFSFGFGQGEDDIRRTVEAAIFCADASDRDDAHGLPEDGRPGSPGSGEAGSRPSSTPPANGWGRRKRRTSRGSWRSGRLPWIPG